jgi:hypothetical protein
VCPPKTQNGSCRYVTDRVEPAGPPPRSKSPATADFLRRGVQCPAGRDRRHAASRQQQLTARSYNPGWGGHFVYSSPGGAYQVSAASHRQRPNVDDGGHKYDVLPVSQCYLLVFQIWFGEPIPMMAAIGQDIRFSAAPDGLQSACSSMDIPGPDDVDRAVCDDEQRTVRQQIPGQLSIFGAPVDGLPHWGPRPFHQLVGPLVPLLPKPQFPRGAS